MEVKNKDLKELSKNSKAIDITHATHEEIQKIKEKERFLEEIAQSKGIYGITGLLLRGYQSGSLYVITSRTGAMYSV